MTTILEEIAAERARQIAHGYDADHDDGHRHYELAQAAICHLDKAAYHIATADRCPLNWPFETAAWKTLDRRQSLIRAAAFIVAEVERLDRLDAGKPEV